MTKTVFISGASSGFGKASAYSFVKAGFKVILAARRYARLEELRDELKQVSPLHASNQHPAHIVQLDVRDRAQVNDVVQSLPEAFSDIDVLINSAGLALGLGKAPNIDIDDWETMIDTNIKGLSYLSHAILPGMVERNCGHIINIGSISGAWPYPGGNTYGATKAFVEQFSRGLRADLLGHKVKVTCVSPGMAETEFSKVRFKGDVQKAGDIYRGTEALQAQDIADIVLWLANTPPHVNVNALEVMPVYQAWGPLAIYREE